MNGRLRRALLATAAVALVGTALAGGALAVGGVKTYTGCLTVSGGTLILIKEGSSPQKPCPSGTVQVRLSEGDITAVTAGTGLTGGGTSGEVSLAIAASFRLPQGCAAGKIAKWDGDSWECADDADTTYTAGTGIDIASNAISVEPGYRLPQSATTGDSVKRAADGTWVAEQYTRAGEACTSGQFVTGTSASGGLSCAAPPASGGLHAYSDSTTYVPLAGTETVAQVDVPPGPVFLFVTFQLSGNDNNDTSRGSCEVSNSDGPIIGTGSTTVNGILEQGEFEAFGLQSAVDHPGGLIRLSCTEDEADIEVFEATLTAIPIGALN